MGFGLGPVRAGPKPRHDLVVLPASFALGRWPQRRPYVGCCVRLEPGRKKTIQFTLYTDQLALYNPDMKLVVEPGEFEVMIGSSSEDIRLNGKFEIVGETREVGQFRKWAADVEVS